MDAHVDCAVGYLNDTFAPTNSFFQPNPDNPSQMLVINCTVLPSRRFFERIVNYGWDYWSEILLRSSLIFYSIVFLLLL